MNKKAILIWVILVILGIFYLKWSKRDVLQVTMCDVGQGDAYILSYKSYQVLVDGGPSRRILECIASVMPVFDKELELVIATHPDKDHIGGLQYVLTMYKVDQIITNGDAKQTTTYTAFRQAIRENEVPEKIAEAGQEFGFERLKLDIVWPEVADPKTLRSKNGENTDSSIQMHSSVKAKIDDTNARSITFRLEFGGFSALFTGDLEITQEQLLISSGVLEEVTLLKVGHHGSKHSTSQDFLKKLNPSVAFIGVGKNNTYGHPTKRVMDLLEENSIKIYRSDLDGQVDLETDGTSLWKI